MTREYAGPFTEAEALLRARATCAAVADARGLPYPMPPGASHGRVVPTAAALEAAATHILAPVRELEIGEWWVEVPDEARALPAAPIRFGDVDVAPVRSGVPVETANFRADAPMGGRP